MTTPLVTGVWPRIVELLEALVPPTRPSVRYRQARTAVEPEDEDLDRLFWFALQRSDAVSEDGTAVTETEWTFALRVALSDSGHSVDSLEVALANEATLIRRALETNTSFPDAGVLSMIVGALDVEREDRAAVLAFTVRATTQEDD